MEVKKFNFVINLIGHIIWNQFHFQCDQLSIFFYQQNHIFLTCRSSCVSHYFMFVITIIADHLQLFRIIIIKNSIVFIATLSAFNVEIYVRNSRTVKLYIVLSIGMFSTIYFYLYLIRLLVHIKKRLNTLI